MVWPKNFVGAEAKLRVGPCRRLKEVWLWVFLPSNMYDTHLSGWIWRPRSEHLRSTLERAALWASGEGDNIDIVVVTEHGVWFGFSLLQRLGSMHCICTLGRLTFHSLTGSPILSKLRAVKLGSVLRMEMMQDWDTSHPAQTDRK